MFLVQADLLLMCAAMSFSCYCFMLSFNCLDGMLFMEDMFYEIRVL